jgi:hypothetical protein
VRCGWAGYEYEMKDGMRVSLLGCRVKKSWLVALEEVGGSGARS